MKILIAIPCMDNVPVAFAESLINLYKPQQTAVCFKPNSLVYDARNCLSITAIENNFDRVMWIDSDMDVPIYAMAKLSEDMDNLNAEMVTGVYVKRKIPTEPLLYEKLEVPELVKGRVQRNIDPYMSYPRNQIFPIAGCGFGCVMTSVKLLKEVWEKYENAFIPFPWAGEDLSFCYRVNKLGYQIYCDSSVSCGHIGYIRYTETDLERGDQVDKTRNQDAN